MTRTRRTFADVGAITLATSILLAGLLSAGSAQAVPAAPVAAKSPVITYVALGDSYAAGQGAGSYEDACLRTDLGYPGLLDTVKFVKLVTNASCTGATTSSVITDQLSTVTKTKHVDVVTITVGANDLGVGALTAACLASVTSPQCQAAFANALSLLTPPAPGVPSPLAVRLATTLASVAAAAPDATILVTGYPYLFETPPPTDPNYATIVQINTATATLNATIQAVVGQLALTGADIRYVDVTAAFAGHGIGSTEPWIVMTGSDAFHPTAAGYQAYAEALATAL